jgi:hypothetical protein
MSLKFKRRLFPDAMMDMATAPESFVAGLKRNLHTDPQQGHPFLTRLAAGDLPNSGAVIYELTEMVRYGLIGHRQTLKALLDSDLPELADNAAVRTALTRRVAGFGVVLGQLKEHFAGFQPLPLDQLLALAESAGANLSHARRNKDLFESLGENLSHDPLWEWSRQGFAFGTAQMGHTAQVARHPLMCSVGQYWDPADWMLLVTFAAGTPAGRAAFARGFCHYVETYSLTCDALYARCVAYDDRMKDHSWGQVA